MRQLIDRGYLLIRQGNELHASAWTNDVVFGWRWWLVVALSVFPWVIAYPKIAPSKRKQYLVASLLTMLLASYLDVWGLSYDLWRYYVVPLPVAGGFFPWNFSVLPISFLIGYELFPKWPQWVKAGSLSLILAFGGEEITELLQLTSHYGWKHVFSIPIYASLYLISYYGGRYLCSHGRHSERRPEVSNREKMKGIEVKYDYLFKHSFDAIYYIEKKHLEKNFRFTEINDMLCAELGYTREELMKLDPRHISDQESYNVDIKYRPLLSKGSMLHDTTFVTKSGEKRYVRVFAKAFLRKDKIEILSIVKFKEAKVVENQFS